MSLIIALCLCLTLSLLYSLPLSPVSFLCSSSVDENLTVSCNAGCSCVRELYNPVCGADGVMYYSPCHAGCKSINHTEMSTGKQVQCSLDNQRVCECVNVIQSESSEFRIHLIK